MATQNTASVLGGAGGTNLLPRSVSEEIWKTATAEAIVPTLAKAHPVTLGENIIPVLTKRPGSGRQVGKSASQQVSRSAGQQASRPAG